MIQDLALRWAVTLLFVFSAAAYVQAIAVHRHSVSTVISQSLHAVMAIAMTVMAWPRGAEPSAGSSMLFFAAAAVWFAVRTLRATDHRGGNAYHTLMMAAMVWMYAAMGGIPRQLAGSSRDTAMAGMDMPDMPGMNAGLGHAGHAGPPGHAVGQSGTEPAIWIAALNWLCAIGFTVAAVFWLYSFITTRLRRPEERPRYSLGILGQLAMAAGMAIMFGVML